MPSLSSAASHRSNRSEASHTPAHAPHPDSLNSASLTPQPARQVRWGQDSVHLHPLQLLDDESGHAESRDEEANEESDGAASVLAICAMKGRVGCCYYEAETEKLHFVEDQADTVPGWDLATLILEQLHPQTVLTSASADADFVSSLERTLSTLPSPSSASAATSGNDEDETTAVRLEYRPAREFYAGAGKMALSRLEITEGGWYEEADENGQGKSYLATPPHGRGEQTELFTGLDGVPAGQVEDESDAYDFGRSSKRRRLNGGEDEGERAQRNRELRLEGFLNGLVGSPITVRRLSSTSL
ncbi:hypothetical protein JCM11251_001835 [Rhodosporidiobolus azoricus]